MQKDSLNKLYDNLSVKEEFSITFKLFKKVILSFLLIYLYTFLAFLPLIGIGYFFNTVEIKMNFQKGSLLLFYIFAAFYFLGLIFWQIYLQCHIVLKATDGNFSVIKLTEIKNVLPRLFMFSIRVLIFFIIAALIELKLGFLLQLFYDDNRGLLLISSTIIFFALAFFVFVAYFFSFFLVSYPATTFKQAFNIIFKFVWQNYKKLLPCFLPVFGFIALSLFNSYGMDFLRSLLKGGGLKSTGFYFGVTFYYLLLIVIFIIASAYIITYIGVIFKKYEAKNNLTLQEVIS